MMILGIDPGLAAVGWAALENQDGKWTTCEAGWINTIPRKGPKTQDDVRRYTEIRDDLRGLMAIAQVVGVEAYSTRPGKVGNRSAGAGVKTAIVYGLVLGMALVPGRNVYAMHPNQTRARMGLPAGAPKEAVHKMVCLEVLEASRLLLAVPKGQREHVGDAVALAVAAYYEHKGAGLPTRSFGPAITH
jgi:Holliday junction resolvasome RuvABC endonuclease subunit